jgi:hypothetical protein
MTDLLDARRQGDDARDGGMALAARRKRWLIAHDTLRFLDALLAHSEGVTLDAAVDDLADKFGDGGKWRGSITRELARGRLIERVGVVHSDRPSRHRGYVARWRIADREGVERRRDELRRWFADHPHPPEYRTTKYAGTLFSSVKPARPVAAEGPGKVLP